MNTLNQWEAESKKYLKAYEGMSNYLPEERILALIELVRKKDEALKKLSVLEMSYEEVPNECRWSIAIARETLALTEQLK